MNHIIKGIIIVAVAITSMLAVGATSMTPIFRQGSAQVVYPMALTIDLVCGPCPPTPIPVTIKGNNPQPSSLSLSADNIPVVLVGRGNYAVSVGLIDGFDVVLSQGCKGSTGTYDHIVCTINVSPN
jgi:hypothetical protein